MVKNGLLFVTERTRDFGHPVKYEINYEGTAYLNQYLDVAALTAYIKTMHFPDQILMVAERAVQDFMIDAYLL